MSAREQQARDEVTDAFDDAFDGAVWPSIQSRDYTIDILVTKLMKWYHQGGVDALESVIARSMASRAEIVDAGRPAGLFVDHRD